MSGKSKINMRGALTDLTLDKRSASPADPGSSSSSGAPGSSSHLTHPAKKGKTVTVDDPSHIEEATALVVKMRESCASDKNLDAFHVKTNGGDTASFAHWNMAMLAPLEHAIETGNARLCAMLIKSLRSGEGGGREEASEKKKDASEFERICADAITHEFNSKTPTYQMLTQIAKTQAITSMQISSLQVQNLELQAQLADVVEMIGNPGFVLFPLAALVTPSTQRTRAAGA